ncbi:MAG: substrate-binding domain-containing protein [Trueperaceae bacterium]|nr:substrate-binding domain-containing protein [Trueperaceae bacterium]MCO5173445.1 substrate-binding domain-containing protein [Trueperaceae bacterium]MCW5819814.1 substrate-binding domain-containing protein [Trueperaceae bacterium]
MTRSRLSDSRRRGDPARSGAAEARARAGTAWQVGAGQPGVLVALLNNLDGVFQRSVLQGAGEVAAAHGLSLEPVALGGLSAAEVGTLLERALGTARGARSAQGARGALVLSSALGDADLARLAAAGLPVTLVSHHSAAPGQPTVMFDNHQGVKQLMQHVVSDCGRRRPVYIGGDASQLDSRERELAFRDELLRHDLRVPEGHMLVGGFTPDLARRALREFVAAGNDFDAVVAADYLMAIAAAETLGQAGVRVPDDVVVVGYGDGPEAEAAGVTTVAADVVELGRRAARQLVAQLSSERAIGGRTLLSTHLVRRASSCRARAPSDLV